MNAHHIGSIVRFHRKKWGVSQEGLATLAGVGKTVVFDIENGKLSIQLNTLLKILDTLNITLKLEGPIMNLWEKQCEKS